MISDARFWLSKLNGDVQIVMTIEISRSSPNVVLDLWKLVNDRVECQQVVMINKGENNSVLRQWPATGHPVRQALSSPTDHSERNKYQHWQRYY